MDYTPISPFMRPISRAHLSVPAPSQSTLPTQAVNKWHLLRELSKAKAAFDISDRELTVLQGLLSFFPQDSLEGNAEMIVFPSNRTICERLNGMALSTMRRHVARLVEIGLLIRRDSPNGKRYARKCGDCRAAFGFDLSPLLYRSEEIARAAEAVREAETRVKRLREAVSLMRRDVTALAEFGQGVHPGLRLWGRLRDKAASVAQSLRRKLTAEELNAHRQDLLAYLNEARDVIDGPNTEKVSACDTQSEHHHLNTDKESFAFEPAKRIEDSSTTATHPMQEDSDDEPGNSVDGRATIPLHLVLESCPSLKTFYPGEIRHWHQLHDAARHVRPAMGISASAWDDAHRVMGPERASITIAVILERFSEIKSPGGYLRALSAKAAAGKFSCGPLVMAQLNRMRQT